MGCGGSKKDKYAENGEGGEQTDGREPREEVATYSREELGAFSVRELKQHLVERLGKEVPPHITEKDDLIDFCVVAQRDVVELRRKQAEAAQHAEESHPHVQGSAEERQKLKKPVDCTVEDFLALSARDLKRWLQFFKLLDKAGNMELCLQLSPGVVVGAM